MDPAGQQLGVRLGSVDSLGAAGGGRLWQQPQYTETGKALLARIVAEETVAVPGLGTMLLPGKVGLPMTAAGGLTQLSSAAAGHLLCAFWRAVARSARQ